MRSIKEIGIIGLGKFGMQFGATLAEMGHTVIGVDSNPNRAKLAMNVLTRAYEADATDEKSLIQLGFQNLDTVAVSVGGAMDASIIITLNLQELGAKDILAKAISPVHKKILERIGANRVVQPEVDVARHMAYRVNNPGILDLIPIGQGVLIQEFAVDHWAGKSIADLNLRGTSDVLVAAVSTTDNQDYTFVPDPTIPLPQGAKLLIIGYKDAMSRLKT